MKLTLKESNEFIKSRLIQFGVSEKDAADVADVLIEAEIKKDASHGISCLLKIIDSIKKGEIYPDKNPSIIKEDKSVVILDGENILGPVAGIKAVNIAVKKAKEYGVAVVSLRKSHHLFTIGYYAKIAALNDMIGIVATSTAPAIFAPGGMEKIFGTNPIAFGIPSEKNPIIIDMSSTNIARGKIREAIKNNKKIPSNWALDSEGNPTDNPLKALDGSLQTIGDHKGFWLAFAIDVLSGILSGSASGKEISGTSMHLESKSKDINCKGDFFAVIDISKFIDKELFKSRVSKLVVDIKNSKRTEKEIYIPGEKIYKNKEQFIEIDDGLYNELRGISC